MGYWFLTSGGGCCSLCGWIWKWNRWRPGIVVIRIQSSVCSFVLFEFLFKFLILNSNLLFFFHNLMPGSISIFNFIFHIVVFLFQVVNSLLKGFNFWSSFRQITGKNWNTFFNSSVDFISAYGSLTGLGFNLSVFVSI